jgi:hypothetical protein
VTWMHKRKIIADGLRAQAERVECREREEIAMTEAGKIVNALLGVIVSKDAQIKTLQAAAATAPDAEDKTAFDAAQKLIDGLPSGSGSSGAGVQQITP